MSTNYIAPIWRMPRNANKDKLSNYSIDTSGTNVGIDCGPMSDLFGTASVTYNTSYSIWVKPEFNYNDSTYQTFFGNFASGNNAVLLYYQTADDRWRFLVGDGAGFQYVESATITSNEELGKGEWQHHCVVFDTVNNNAYYYINNQQINSSTSITKKIATNGDFYIGKKWNLSTGKWTGELSQACIFDYALSIDQRNYLYNLNNPMAISGGEPIAYWPLGDNSNPNAPGSFPNISVGADSVFDFIPNDYINLGEDVVPATPAWTSLTVSGWVKKDATGSYGRVIGKDDGGSNRVFLLQVQNNDKLSGSIRTVGGGAWDNVQTTTDVAIGEWQHVAMTYTANGLIRLYINGEVEASGSTSIANLNPVTTDTLIGAKGNITNMFDGQISNVQIWDVEISPTEMLEVYNNGQPLMTGTQPQEANLQAWYKLNQSADYNPGISGTPWITSIFQGTPDYSSGADGAYTDGGVFKWVDNGPTSTVPPFPTDTFALTFLKITGRYSNITLSSTGGTYNTGSGQFPAIKFQYKTDGGSWVDFNEFISTGGSGSWSFTSPAAVSCEDSYELRAIGYGGSDPSGEITLEGMVINSNQGTLLTENFGQPQYTGAHGGSITNPNAVTYVDPVWQIPDNRSAYPQSFNFSQNKIITTSNVFSDIVTGSNKMGICTISYWYKSSGTGQRDYMSLNDATSLAANFRVDSSNRFYYRESNNYLRFVAQTNLDEWHHHCWVFNSATSYSGTAGQTNGDLQFYVNGVVQAVDFNFSATPANDPWDRFNIARSEQVSGSGLDFEMSNLQLYNTNFSASQVLQLYNNGTPLTTAIATDNLKAWYKLDNNEKFDGTNWSVENQKYPASFDSALDFNGSGEHIDVSGFDNALLSDGDISFSLWCKLETTGTYQYILSSTHTGSIAGINIAMRNDTNLLFERSQDIANTQNNTGYSVSGFTYGNWHHLCGTYNATSGELKAYVDGDLKSTTNDSADARSASTALKIGGLSTYATLYAANGQISNVAIFNTTLDSPAVQALYNNGTPETSISSSPVSWWKLNNTTTGIQDSVGSNDGTNNGTTKVNTFVSTEAGISSGMTERNLVNNNVSVVNGESEGMNSTNLVTSNLTRTQPYSNYSFNFDRASSDYFDLGTLQSTALQPSDATLLSDGFSVSMWVNLRSVNTMGLWQNDGLGQTNYAGLLLQINSGGQINFGYSDNTGAGSGNRLNYVTTNNEISALDTWYHIVAIYKGMGSVASPVAQGLYVNGIQVTAFNAPTGTASSLTYSASAKGAIGAVRNSVSHMDGKISNCACFDRTLTQDEVLNIYNNGVPQDLQVTSTFSNNIVAWWPMDEHSSYYDGTDWVIRDIENSRDGDGANTGNVDDIVGNAPGSEASGIGTNLTIADLIGDMKDSKNNAYSINMADYADGVTNPANSGRSTEVPSV